MRVVPVSIAAKAESPVVIGIFWPFTESEEIACNQNVGEVPEGMLWNSMSPVNKDELVPPRVNTPPDTSVGAVGLLRNRANQNDISGLVSWLFDAKACQKGVERVLAIVSNARPMIPDTLPDNN